MMSWAVRLQRVDGDQSQSLWPLRLVPGVEILERDDSVWLRGTKLETADQSKIVALPGRRFVVLADGQLRAVDQRVPCGYLPEGDWQPVSDWLNVELPTPAWSGKCSAVALQLVRSAEEKPAEFLLTDIRELRRFADRSAMIRLQSLQFALADDGRVLLRGVPLPVLPGRFFVMENNVAVPAGWSWQPAVSAAVVRRVFQLRDDNDLVVWEPHPSGQSSSWSRIPAGAFVRVTRSAVRSSAEPFLQEAAK